MAFAIWKKSAHQYENVALQHESLIPLWKDINRYIRENALTLNHYISNVLIKNPTPTTLITYKHSENSIYTGILYSQSSSFEGDTIDQKPEIWFKIIHTERSITKQDGIVILTNNFLISNTDDPTSSKTEENTLKEYCEENMCVNELQNRFEQIGGRVRCCRLTIKIAQRLGIPNIHSDYELLSIRNITI